MLKKELIMFVLCLNLIQQATGACTAQRCCNVNPCTNTYCTQKNSQTWISTQSYTNYGFTKLVLSNSSCLPCSYSCQSCSSETVCTTCASGFYMSSGTCVICSYLCSTCVVVNSISKCSVCSGSTYLDSSSASCKNCATGASACASATVITACQTGYYLTQNSLFCLSCPSNCQSCPISNTICSSCYSGYYLNSSGCYACTLTNCLTCTILSNNQNCLSCSTGYFASSGTCKSCASNCNKCNSATVCTTCAQGYYPVAGGCVKATDSIDNCNTYQNSSACSTCISSYYLSKSLCYPCSLLCTACNGLHFGACTACISTATLFNQMCLVNNYISQSTYQLYYSFPSAGSYATQGAQNCNRYHYSGTAVTLSLNSLAASKIVVRWRIFSVDGSTTYSFIWSNSAGNQNSSYSTSSSSTQAFPLCSTNASQLYYLQIGSKNISTVKVNNTLSFTTNNGVVLALQQVLLVTTMCNSLCVECSDVLCSQCLMSNLYTQDAYCVYSCSSGYYIYNNPASTTNPNTCVQQCPTGTFALSANLSCAKCLSPCLSCLSEKFCLSCIASYFLTSQNTCQQICPYQYYGESLTQACKKCIGRCNECLDQTRCLNCNSGFYYASNYSCLDSCTAANGITGMYADLNTLTCQSCSSSCLNCLLQSTYCTSCKTGLYFYNNTCLPACPSAYYSDSFFICQLCQYPCENCIANASNCTSCVDRYLLNSTCLTDCPNGFYEDNTKLTCVGCNTGCAQCVQSSTNCVQCLTNYYLFNNTCISTCPNQYYGNVTSLICVSCISPCYTCSNNTFCLSCSINFLYNGTCVNSGNCPTSYFADINTLSCLACSSNCLTCQYIAIYCTSCKQNSSATLLQNSTCVASCLSTSTYAGTFGGIAACVLCLSPCQTCSNATYCLSCVSGYMLSGGSCSTSCTAGYFFNSSLVDCQACSAGCLICNSAQFCQICKADYYILSTNDTANQCVESCGAQKYASSVSSSCRSCIYPCFNCTSTIQCLSCQQGVLYQSRCLSNCPDTTYLNSASSTCSPCQGNCLTCSKTSKHCLTCLPNYYLSTLDNTCNLLCPASTYPQNVTQMCLPCSSSCSSCTNSTYCTACIANRTYLYAVTHICISDCPLGYFANSTATNCDFCNVNCLTCRLTASNCLSCAANFYLIRLSVSSYDCVDSCSSGYYKDSQNCEACIFPCKTCSSANACLTCVQGTYFYAKTSACLLGCPSNAYIDVVAQTCQMCTSPCSSCRSSTYCLSCLSNLYLLSGQCVSICPSQYYSDTTQMCIQCSGLCKTCSTKYFCLSCLTGYLSNGYCYSSCPPGTFANLNQSKCQNCITPCLQCTFSTTYCTRCTGSHVVYQGNCSSSCPLGTYLSDSSCLACQFPCINCTGPQTCQQCLGGYLLYNSLTCINYTAFCPNDFYKMDGKYCIPKSQCPSNYFTDSDLKTCSSSCAATKYTILQTKSCGYNCQGYQYAGIGMSCKNFSDSPPASLMGMVALVFIKSNIINIVVSFNESVTWLGGGTAPYTLSSTSITTTGSSNRLNYSLNSGDPTNIILKVVSVPAQIGFFLPANYLISSITNYPLQNPNMTLSLPSFVAYDYSTIYQGLLTSQFGYGLGWFILLLSIFYLFKNRISHLYTLWDTVQLLFVTILLQIQYPPALNEFLRGLNTTLFLSFPNIFAQNSIRTTSSRPFYAYTYDNNFLRNAGPSLTIGIIVIIVYLVFKITAQLTKRVQKVHEWMNEYPKIKRFMYETLLRFRWHYASDVFFLTYTSVFLFGVAELRNLSLNPNRSPSNAICVITLIVYLVFPIFAGIKLLRHFPNISKGKHSQNLRCFYRGIDKTSQFGVFLIMIRYFRKLVYALIIGIFSQKPMFALPILMFTSVLMALFIFLKLPFKKRLSNIVQIINQCCIALLFLGMAIINYGNQQGYIGFNIALGYVCTGLLIFILLLLVFEVFCRSLFHLKSQQEIRNENSKKIEDLSEAELRRKAGEFFDYMFPRIRNDLGFGEQSDEEQEYKYEEGDSQNSQNNMRRQEEWGIKQSDQDSDEFRHYKSESEQATEGKQKAPQYLIRCVKQLK